MSNSNKKRGGPRPGSGPKLKPSGKRVTQSAKVKPSTKEKLQKESIEKDISVGKIIDWLVEEYL